MKIAICACAAMAAAFVCAAPLSAQDSQPKTTKLKDEPRALAALLQSPNAKFREDAARRMSKIVADVTAQGPEAVAEFLTCLRDALKDPEKGVREAAAQALGAFGPAAKDAVADLTAATKDVDKLVRWQAIYALGRIGPDARDAVAALAEGIKDNEICFGCIAAIGMIGPDAKSAAPALAGCLVNKDPLIRAAAAESLGRIGPDAKDAVPALAFALKDERTEVILQAVIALGRIGPDSKPAMPGLSLALRHNDKDIRLAAAHVMEKFGKVASSAVADLGDSLFDKEPAVRQAALAALMTMPGEAKQVLRQVKRMAEADSRPELKKLAEQAAAAIEKAVSPASAPAGR